MYSVDLAAGDVFAFYVGASEVGEFEIKYNWVEGEVSTGGGAVSDGEIAGIYTGSNTWGNATIALTVTEDTISYVTESQFMGTASGTYTYTYEDGFVTLYDNGTPVINPLVCNVTVENGVITVISIGGTDSNVIKSL